MIRGLPAVCCLLGLLAGCSLPDMRRGQHALATGDPDAAEANFRPLADLGYADAELKLAKIYSQKESPDELREAARWYRAALEKDPAQAVPLARVLLRLNTEESMAEAEQLLQRADIEGDPRSAAYMVELYTDYPERDQEGRAEKLVERVARYQDPEAESAVVRWYRKHVQEPRYAALLLKRCEKARQREPECYVDLARHYRGGSRQQDLQALADEAVKGYRAGNIAAPVLTKLGWVLFSEELGGTPLPESAYAVLKLVQDSSPLAQTRLARVLVEYPHLEPEAKPEKLLQKAAAKDFPEAHLALGRLYIRGLTVPTDPAKAAGHFEKAAPFLPGANYYLGRIYKRGELGEADPVMAARYLLTAARQGYVQADVVLAQLYSDKRGVRANPVNAWAFASIAAANGVPQGQELLAQLKASMSAADIQRAQGVMQKELAARQTAAPTTTATARAPTPEGQR